MSSVQSVQTGLRREFLGADAQKGMRLPPVRTLARQFSVSSATVIKALRALEAEGLLNAVHGSGVYIAGTAAAAAPERCLTLASTWPDIPLRPENFWMHQINQAIFRAAARHERRISILPLDAESASSGDEMERRLLEMSEGADALLFMPFAGNKLMDARNAFRKAGKPVVSFHPVSWLSTANFVGLDHLTSARNIVAALADAGRRRFAYLFPPRLFDSYSGSLQYLGLQSALMDAGLPPLEAVCLEESSRETACREMKRRKLPVDAVLAAGDFLALGAIQALRETGRSVPQEVSVISLSGGNGPYLHDIDLTAMVNPFEAIGQSLIAMVVKCVGQPLSDVPGEHLPLLLHCGATTRPGENDRLREAASIG